MYVEPRKMVQMTQHSTPRYIPKRMKIYVYTRCIHDVWTPRGESGGGRVGGMNWEIGIDIYTLICIKQITNKNMLYKKK